MEQEYIKGDIVMYDNKIHTIMDALGVNNYELSYIEHPVHQLELSGVPLTPEILKKNGCQEGYGIYYYEDITVVYIDNYYWIVGLKEIADVLHIDYVHQLQHFLFGLDLNSDMNL